MSLAKSRQFVIRGCTYLLLIFFLSTQSPAQPNRSDIPEWKQELIAYINKATKLYASDKGDIALAARLLEIASFHKAANYYEQASLFYFHSIKKSSFDTNPDDLEKEARRILPILGDSVRCRWESFIKSKNDQLVEEIIRYWSLADPIFSSTINERLIEHWRRIAYSRQHFTRNKDSPYETDDRGTIYVRFGAPDISIEKNITVRYALSPVNGRVWRYTMGLYPEVNFELWRYFSSGTQEEHYYIFGKKKGIGKFGLQRCIMDVMDFTSIGLIEGTHHLPSPIKRKNIAENVFVLGVFEQLAAYHSNFSEQHYELINKITHARNNINRAYSRQQIEQVVRSKSVSQRDRAPASETTTIPDYKKLDPEPHLYQFRDQEGKAEYVIAIDANIDKKLNEEGEDLVYYGNEFLLNTGLETIASSGRKISQSYSSVISQKNISTPQVYSVKTPDNGGAIFYASEVFNPDLQDVAVSPEIAGLAPSTMLWASGRKRLPLPPTSISADNFDISDIVLGKDQESNTDHRLPITPKVVHQFRQDSTMMIYFEAYNIPEGGYSFEYYFEKHRWLFKNKRPDEKPSVTIINDKISGRDEQLFSISLSDLEEGTYNLVFEFRLLNQDQEEPAQTRNIELVIEG